MMIVKSVSVPRRGGGGRGGGRFYAGPRNVAVPEMAEAGPGSGRAGGTKKYLPCGSHTVRLMTLPRGALASSGPGPFIPPTGPVRWVIRFGEIREPGDPSRRAQARFSIAKVWTSGNFR
ncbi:hypothetical protein NL676_037044 [Syzygium grande]|nr:hypothetical protein NL676_037044 [Syzygium grande]